MANSNNQLSQRLTAQGASMVPSGFEEDVKIWYRSNAKRLNSLVGGDREKVALYISAAFSQINRVPQLLDCTPESFFNCLIYSMGTSLLPGPYQECVFVPFNNKGKKEATFIPMYQGLVKLCFNSGFVTKIWGLVVWEADEFDYNPAEDLIHHVPFRGAEKDRGKRVAVYCNIKNIHGEIMRCVKFAEFVESIKKRSNASKSSFSPWNSEYPSDIDTMWLKTAFKQAAKWVPKSSSANGLFLNKAIELDNKAESGEELIPGILSDEIDSVKHKIMELPEAQSVPKAKTKLTVEQEREKIIAEEKLQNNI